MKKQNILIAGANGTTGRIIVDKLKSSEKHNPIAMVRKEDQKEYFEKKEIPCVLGDLEKDIEHTLKGADKVIFAAGSGGKKVVEVDQEGAKKMIDASEKKDIQKFVMLSSMGADNPSVSSELKEYLEAKQNADDYLRKSNLNYSIVRPGSLTNNEASHKIEIENKLNKFGKISRENVALTLIETLNDDTKDKQTFEILDGNTPIEEALN